MAVQTLGSRGKKGLEELGFLGQVGGQMGGKLRGMRRQQSRRSGGAEGGLGEGLGRESQQRRRRAGSCRRPHTGGASALKTPLSLAQVGLIRAEVPFTGLSELKVCSPPPSCLV